MDVISQFLVDLSWGLTYGALIAAGTLAAKAAGAVAAGLAVLGAGYAVWRRHRKRQS